MMRLLARAAAVTAAGAAVIVLSAAGAAQAAGTPHWHLVYRTWSTRGTDLTDVTAVSARDAWAAGGTPTASGTGRALLMHWNGTSWRPVTIPHAAGFPLDQVQAPAASDVWVFGLRGSTTQALRWDGHAWLAVPVPAGVNVIDDAPVVLGPSDVWLVGQQSCAGGGTALPCQTTLQHWNGSTWTPYTIPTLVNAISGTRPGGVWAVASRGITLSQLNNGRGRYRLAAYRWAGGAWQVVSSIPHPTCLPVAAEIAVQRGGGVWVSAAIAHKGNFVLHWNGHTWARHRVPFRTPAGFPLLPTSPLLPDGRGGVWLGALVHFTGTRWVNTVPPPSFAHGYTTAFITMARVPGSTTVWAAGGISRTRSGPPKDAFIAAYPSAP